MNDESERESLCRESERGSCHEEQTSKELHDTPSYIDRENGNKNDHILKRYVESISLDYSPSSSVFESEELDITNFESDAFEHESGVESVDGDWPRSCDTPPDLDLTDEQALESLKYFTLSLSRANQMTKTHQDLDAVLELLQEKEKDLELAAHIGQSLLERNRNLYKKTEVLENYVNEVEERETQLKHVVSMKDKLLKTFAEEDDLGEDDYNLLLSRDSESSAYSSCKDETMLSLHEKCHKLEEQNTSFIVDALKLREETDKEEEKEKQLVYECIKELGHAKEQISHLTDEISLKAEDNIEQQEEISKLISTVLDLQERHNHLTEENEGLHETLKSSQESQKDLQSEVSTLHDKFQECFEMLIENQREMKIMKEKLGSRATTADSDSSPQGLACQDPRDSLAQEIEQSVRRDLETSQEKKKHTNRIMQTVRVANTSKRFPKVIKGGSRPTKSAGQANAGDKPFDFTFAVSAKSSKKGKETPTMDELRAAVRRLSVSENTSQGQRTRRPWAPEKLQIVKPMEGSATLHKWQSLARPTMSGLHNVHPGVYVKGGTAVQSERKEEEEEDSAVESGHQSTGSDAVRTSKAAGKDDKDKTPEKQSVETVKSSREPSGKLRVVAKHAISSSQTTTTSKPTQTAGKPSQTAGKPPQISSKLAVTGGSVSSGAPSNLTEIVKSKLSTERAVGTPENESGSLLSKVLRSTAGVHSAGNLVNSMPVTTVARTSFVPTTTTVSSMALCAFPRPLLVRSRSSENLVHLMNPLNQQHSVETTATTPSISTESLSAPNVTANQPVASQGFGGFVGRLVRSSSNENLAATKDTELGFSRSSSSGKLSDMVKNSNLYPKIGKSSSFDTVEKSKRASFQLGTSPPSPSQLELMGGFTFFGSSYSSSKPAPEATTTTVQSGSTRSVFGALSGLGGFFRPRSKSMDNLGPLPASFSSSTSNLDKSSRSSLVERSMKRFNQAFGPD